jgi:hypothetical protein
MSQLIRSIATSINCLAGTHLCAPRRRARLPLRFNLIDPKTQIPLPRVATFAGHTWDISATGLAILLPVARFSEQLLNQGHRTLRIVLELATGSIEADASVVRYEQMQSKDGLMELGYLLGAQIVNISEVDRERFLEHLRSIN